jgi:hypothetical protein
VQLQRDAFLRNLLTKWCIEFSGNHAKIGHAAPRRDLRLKPEATTTKRLRRYGTLVSAGGAS